MARLLRCFSASHMAQVPKLILEKPLVAAGCMLGEGPIFDPRTSILHFVDIQSRKVFHYNTQTNDLDVETFDIPITSLALRLNHPGLACTTAQGFAILEGDSKYRHLCTPFSPDEAPHVRFNDGVCDSRGRYLAGNVYNEEHGIPGRLWRYDPTDGSCDVLDKGPFTDSNGLGWSPDEKTFYFTDSLVDLIYAYDYIDGEIANRRVFAHGQDHGLLPNTFPDGLCIDSEGGLWTARWLGGRVSRYNSNGQIDFEIELPTALIPTSCCFGGAENDLLYITTAHCGVNGNDASRQEKYPDSGSVFAADLKGKYRGATYRYPFAG